MKRETLRHPKTFDLAARLQCSRATALGYLTLLWDFTADVSTDGSIGKWADGSIARACDWDGEPSDFICGLIEAGWLDRDPVHRLLVHDWEDHCKRWVKLKLQKLGIAFATPTELATVDSTERSIEASIESPAEPSPPRDQTKPTLTEPNQTKHMRSSGDERAHDSNGQGRYSKAFELWWSHYPRKVAKQAAYKAYQNATKRVTHESLLVAVQAFQCSDTGRSDFCPYPATWLNSGRYDDDPEEWKDRPGSNGHPVIDRSNETQEDKRRRLLS